MLIAPVQTCHPEKTHAIFLKAWGLGVDEATDDPVPTPHRLCQQVPARSSTRIEGGRDRDVTYTRCPYYSCSIRPDVASIPSHTRHRCPLSCSVRQQGACSRRRHPRRDAGASSRPLAASKPPLTTLSFVLHGLPPPAPAPLWFGRPGWAVKWRARPDRVTTHQGVRAAALAVLYVACCRTNETSVD